MSVDRHGEQLVGEPAAAAAVPDFDHLDPAIADDPYPVLGALRASCPVAHSTAHGGFYVVTGYDATRALAMDGATFSSNVPGIGAGAKVAEIDSVIAPLFEADGESHRAWRHLLQPYFKPAAAAAHEDFVRRISRETIAEFVADGRADLVTAYTQRIPPLLIGRMLGLDDDEQMALSESVRALTAARSAEAAQHASRTRDDLLTGCVRDRQGTDHPRDMLSDVAQAVVGGDEPTEREMREMLKFAVVMVAAGNLTATDACATILLRLLEDHDLRDRCVADPAVLLPEVIEESVRHEPAVAATGRAVTTDTELAGVALKRGDRLLPVWGAANRDPACFPDGDEFRLDRPRGGPAHLGWGAGAHRCLGRHVARLELRIMLEELLAAIPDIRLQPGPQPTRSFGVIRGVPALPAEWGTA